MIFTDWLLISLLSCVAAHSLDDIKKASHYALQHSDLFPIALHGEIGLLAAQGSIGGVKGAGRCPPCNVT